MGLQAAGVAPTDIDTVILSHGHPGQIGGATDGAGRLSFPRARYVMSRAEWEFWASEANLATLEELLVTCARTHLPSLRSQIEEIQVSTKSVMPEGLEMQLSKLDVADVIDYLLSVAAK